MGIGIFLRLPVEQKLLEDRVGFRLVGVGEVEGGADVFLDGLLVQFAEDADQVDVVVAVLVQGHGDGVFLVDGKQTGAGAHVHVGLHLQVRHVVGFVEILLDLLVDVGHHVDLVGLPLGLLILVVEQLDVPGRAHDPAVGVNVHDAVAPVDVAVFVRIGVDIGLQLIEEVVDEDFHDQEFVFKVVGDAAFGDVKLIGDLLKGGAAVAVLQKHAPRYLQNLCFQVCVLCFVCHFQFPISCLLAAARPGARLVLLYRENTSGARLRGMLIITLYKL